MEKPSSSRPPHRSSAGRRVRLIPSTPRQENATLPQTQPEPDTNEGTSRPPETFGGNLYSNIIREAVGRLNHEESSIGSSSDGTNLAESLGNATSSSSIRFSDGRTFDEIANEVIQGMREDERERVIGGTQELREPEEILDAEENRGPQENPVREILDITGTEEEGATASGDWRAHIENMVNQLLIENAEQNAMIKAQREKMTKIVDIVDRIIA